jgi:hypothetical protein
MVRLCAARSLLCFHGPLCSAVLCCGVLSCAVCCALVLCAVLRCAVLCCAVLCCAVLCCGRCAVRACVPVRVRSLLCFHCPFCSAVLCCDVLCCAVLSYAVLCVLCCAVLCCAVLCYAMLCCAVLSYAVLCCALALLFNAVLVISPSSAAAGSGASSRGATVGVGGAKGGESFCGQSRFLCYCVFFFLLMISYLFFPPHLLEKSIAEMA